MIVLLIAFITVGCAAAAFSLYLLVLSIAALFYSPPQPRRAPTHRLTVLIPAHDEAALIGRCVRSFGAQSYPRHLFQVVVVADNCTDGTASIAGLAGADAVLVRDEPQARGKGHALRWAMDILLFEPKAPDAIVVVDADSVADPDFLLALAQPFEAGAQAVQGESLLYGDGSTASELRVAAFRLVNRVRPSGRSALGLPATSLAGNGMLLARNLLLAKPWEAYTSAEDLEYGLDLQMAGVRIAFAGRAVVLSPPAPNAAAAATQQLRWEGGKVHLARTRIPQLVIHAVRRPMPSLLGTAFELALPPLGFIAATAAAGMLLGGALTAGGVTPAWTLVPWLLASTAIVLSVLIGLWAGQASKSEYRALLRSPLFVVTKPARALGVVRFRGDTWVRTERAPEPEVGNRP
jgi:1,2-diacylglycerol 3-beta-glucosyltransferase